jgi:hypothetical protein
VALGGFTATACRAVGAARVVQPHGLQRWAHQHGALVRGQFFGLQALTFQRIGLARVAHRHLSRLRHLLGAASVANADAAAIGARLAQ